MWRAQTCVNTFAMNRVLIKISSFRVSVNSDLSARGGIMLLGKCRFRAISALSGIEHAHASTAPISVLLNKWAGGLLYQNTHRDLSSLSLPV